MKTLDKLQELLECEIDKTIAKGEITAPDLKALGEAVDILKDIETTRAMEEYGGNEDEEYSMMNRGYSTKRMNRYPMRGSYDHMDMDYSYEDRRMGRDDYSTRRDSRGRYSRHTEKEEMIEKLEMMAENAKTEQERREYMECIEKLEKH